ncbi:MAG: hypothetical protein JO119_15990, partial [Acidobacteria bacterium]|nr:hypothetical protein [Acidobacteriota bacterium]
MTNPNFIFPRSLSAAEYVLALHEPDDRVAIVVRNRFREQTTQRISRAEDIANPSFQNWLQEQNDRGADAFVGMNPLRANSFARTKESVREIRHVYLDLDEDAAASLRAIRTDGSTPIPNFVLDTSPDKNQVVWRVDGLDRAQAERLLRSLANEFGGDTAATDISRVLRLPGFVNRKYSENFVVRVVQETDAIYGARDFAIHDESLEAPRRLPAGSESPRRIANGHKSQSEADWAYAKRALERGDTPNDVVRRIADYRADDKADPLYYARLTVEKARMASLKGLSQSSLSTTSKLNRETNEI